MKQLITLLLLASSALWGGARVTFRGPDQIERQYTLKDHPRVWFDGPDGRITLRLKDPDGMGSGRNSYYDSLMAQGLVQTITTARATYPNNGLKNNPVIYQIASNAALLWWMCNQCTLPWDGSKTWLDYATDIYLHLYDYTYKRWHGSVKYGDGNAADTGEVPHMGDYGGPFGAHAALGYSLIRDQLTTQQRATVASYFLNGINYNDRCELPFQRQPGTISKSGKVLTITGASWADGLAINDTIEIRAYKDINGKIITSNKNGWTYTFYSAFVTAINGNQLTIKEQFNTGPMDDFTEGYYSTYLPWDQSKTCNFMYVFSMRGDLPPYADTPRPAARATLETDMAALDWPNTPTTGVVQTIDVGVSNWTIPGMAAPTPATPWRAIVGDDPVLAEVVDIEGINGNTLTIRRGKYMYGFAHPKMRPYQYKEYVTVVQYSNYGTTLYNNGLNNRELTRAQSYLAIGLAFADDDARAVTLLHNAANYFTSDSYMLAKNLFTLWNFSVGSYQFGRGNYFYRMALFLTNSVSTPSADWTAGSFLKDQAWYNVYWARPWAMNEPVEVGGTHAWWDCFSSMNSNADCGATSMLSQLAFPNEDSTKFSWAFLTQTNGYAVANGAAAYANFNSYLSEGMATWMMLLGGYPNYSVAADRTTAPLSFVRTKGDNQPPGGYGYKMAASRGDWTPGSSYGYYVAMDESSDKLTGEQKMATYGIGKNGWFIYTPAVRSRNYNMAYMNQVDFGTYTQSIWYPYCSEARAKGNSGMCPVTTYPTYGTAKSDFLWISSDLRQLHMAPPGANNGDLHGFTNGRWWRQFIHLRGGKEYFIVVDDISKSINEKFRVRTMYNQNGETNQTEGGRNITEGNTAIAPDFASVNSQTGGTEGPVTKLITKWLFTGGAMASAVYDMPTRAVAWDQGTWGIPVGFELCSDASAIQPCRIKVGSQAYSFTAPLGTVTVPNPSTNLKLKQVWMWFDPSDGTAKVGWESGADSTCTGSISCVGAVPAMPEGAVLLLHYQYSVSGEPYDYCMANQEKQTGAPPVGNGTCYGTTPHPNWSPDTRNKYDNVRPIMVESAPTTSGVAWMWHRPTTDLSEEGDNGTEVSVSGTGALHTGLLISGSDPAIVILPLANARATLLSFLASNATPARLLVAGLAEGSYRVMRDGVQVAGGLMVERDEAALYLSGLEGGEITVERVSATPLRAYNPGTFPQAVKGQPFQFQLGVGGGTPPYQWSCCGFGALPQGLSVSPDGIVSGTPLESGQFNLSFVVTDGDSPSQSSQLAVTLTVVDPDAAVQKVDTRSALLSDRAVVLSYDTTGLSDSQSCTVRLTTDAQLANTLSSKTDRGGKAKRQVHFTPPAATLTAQTTFYAEADCGLRSGTTSVTTLPAQPATTTPVSFQSSAPPGAVVLQVEYGSTEQLGQNVTVACSGKCTGTVPAQPRSILFLRLNYLNGAQKLVARSSIFPVQAR